MGGVRVPITTSARARTWLSSPRIVNWVKLLARFLSLEVLVQAEIGRPPDDYQLLRIECPDSLGRTEYPETAVPKLDQSRAWGVAWLAAGETALARVPSAIAPHSCNMLINPRHPEAARIRVAAASRWPWVKRLFSSG